MAWKDGTSITVAETNPKALLQDQENSPNYRTRGRGKGKVRPGTSGRSAWIQWIQHLAVAQPSPKATQSRRIPRGDVQSFIPGRHHWPRARW